MPEKKELDARGLVCPMPIIKLSKAIKEVEAGGQLAVFADDPAFESDIKTWCQKVGHTLIDFKTEGTDFVALIEKR